jgi:hypothetical protein
MAADYADPTHECDVVMKGGITSGVVYPGAVDRLARRYTFRSIGGTSAGAIAAALLAAAQHARNHGRPEAFATFAGLPTDLGAEQDGQALLQRLFQPDAETAPLFDVMIGAMAEGPAGAIGAAVVRFWHFPLAAAAIAAASVALVLGTGVDWLLIVVGVLLALIVAGCGLAYDLVRAGARLAGNDFGLCRLGPDAVGRSLAQPALTVWLHEQIQALSGAGGVLTFADLWGVPAGIADPEKRRRAQQCYCIHPDRRAVDLQMVTTDLTHGRPWLLPVPYRPYGDRLEDDGGLLFDPAELRRFFPDAVVDHLVAHGSDPSGNVAAALAEMGDRRPDYRCFPIGPDLPVVVAARMSLSFPVLISTIPLHQVQFRKKGAGPPVLRQVTFSDGGISSNFPVHLFDASLPTRPTFALDLTGFEPGDRPDPTDPCHSVDGPTAPNVPAIEPMAQFTSMPGFFTAIKDAMQNWRDNTASRLPGQRERVAHVRLDGGEGGLNLTMGPEKLTELSARGACAGERLVAAFAGPPNSTAETEWWNDHRYVRFRVAMSLMQRQLGDLARGYDHDFGPQSTSYAKLAAAHVTAPPYPYDSQARADFAQTRADEYVRLSQEPETLDDPAVPRPPSTMRRVPPA